MKKRSLLAAFSIMLLITACGSNPMNRKYSDKTFKEDAQAINESKKLNDDDKKLLVGYIIRSKVSGVKLEDMT